MSDDAGTYKGVLGAFPYAFRASPSWLFRTYVVLAGLLAVLLVALFLLALPGWIANSANQSATVTLSRAFLVLVFLAVGTPIIAPVLLVARRHRRVQSVASTYDRALAAAGYLFVVSLYLGLVIATPEPRQETVSGSLAPVVAFLYGLPRPVGVVPPIVAVVLLVVLHRRLTD